MQKLDEVVGVTGGDGSQLGNVSNASSRRGFLKRASRIGGGALAVVGLGAFAAPKAEAASYAWVKLSAGLNIRCCGPNSGNSSIGALQCKTRVTLSATGLAGSGATLCGVYSSQWAQVNLNDGFGYVHQGGLAYVSNPACCG